MKKTSRPLSLLLSATLAVGLSVPALAANGQEYYLKTTVTVQGGLRSGGLCPKVKELWDLQTNGWSLSFASENFATGLKS